MGVFLSKPCVDKFSEDGEDDGVVFGVSSMQGWRKSMEDAHLAVLDLHKAAAGAQGAEEVPQPDGEQQSLGKERVRLFGVFDGHGGKEVALFVQDHLAQELVKLEEYKGGDFPSALARSFHRMDEMLEVAAEWMRRRRQGSPQGAAELTPGGDAGAGGGRESNPEASAGGAAGAETGGDMEEVRQGNILLEKLSLYRARKNPSDIELEREPQPGQVEVEAQGAADDKDKETGKDGGAPDEEGAERPVAEEGATAAVAPPQRDLMIMSGGRDAFGAGAAEQRDVTNAGSEAGAAAMGGGRAPEKIKIADALDLFQRILHMGKEPVVSRPTRPDIGKGEGDGADGNGGGGRMATGWSAGDGAAKQDAAKDGGDGEDTFGDDEAEDDDVVLANEVAAAGAKPDLGSNMASMVVGMDGPTCNLRDHPIQAGCTSVVCLMVGNTLYVANAGDSRAVLCRGVTAVELSKDHKPLADGERDRIEGAGGFVNAVGRVNGNLNLSRSIGDLKYKANSGLPPASQMITAEPDVRSEEILEQDRFMVLACDGVWDCMSSQECVDFVGARLGKMSLSKICEEVMDYCVSDDPRRTQGIGGDNMTCVIVLLNKSLASDDSVAEQGKTEDATEITADGVSSSL